MPPVTRPRLVTRLNMVVLGEYSVTAPLLSFSFLTPLSSLDPDSWAGAIGPPFGIFDPLGFSKYADEADILRYRESEVKHGRLAISLFLPPLLLYHSMYVPSTLTHL